jgi:hypothetical protein
MGMHRRYNRLPLHPLAISVWFVGNSLHLKRTYSARPKVGRNHSLLAVFRRNRNEEID